MEWAARRNNSIEYVKDLIKLYGTSEESQSQSNSQRTSRSEEWPAASWNSETTYTESHSSAGAGWMGSSSGEYISDSDELYK